MSWHVLVDDDCKKEFRRIPKNDRERITTVIESFVFDPYAGDIEKMKGDTDTWRRRVGSYRIFYEVRVAKRTVYVFDIRRRSSNTY